jgi:hypothetical protein
MNLYLCMNCNCVGPLNRALRCSTCDSDQVLRCDLPAREYYVTTEEILREAERAERFYNGVVIGTIGAFAVLATILGFRW